MADAIPHTDDSEHIGRGIGAAVGAIFMFTLMNVFAKYLSSNHSVIEIAFYRNLVACVPFLLLIFVFGRRQILVIQKKPHLVAARAIFGVLTLALTFAAYSLMPMTETTVLLFTASLFIPVLGVVFLKEKVGPYRWTAVFTGFVGVAIMANLTGDVNTLGVSIALFAALMQGWAGMSARRQLPFISLSSEHSSPAWRCHLWQSHQLWRRYHSFLVSDCLVPQHNGFTPLH